MKSKFLKFFLLPIAVIFAVVTIYFYTKTPVETKQLPPDKNLPVKAVPILNKYGYDSLLVFIPYKFEISNNRLNRIKRQNLYYARRNLGNGNSFNEALTFDANGYNDELQYNRSYTSDSLLREKKLWERFKFQNATIIFPFTKKEFIYFKPFPVKRKYAMNESLDRKQIVDFRDDYFDKQSKIMTKGSPYKISPKLIDSLYQSDDGKKHRMSVEVVGKENGWYSIDFKINSNEQKFTDVYEKISKMNSQQLLEFMTKPSFEE